MSWKLTQVHQSNVLGWIMHNLDPPFAASIMPCNCIFHTYASRATIVDYFMNGKIISSYHHPQYPKHVIVAYCQADIMLGVIALQADIGVDEQYDSGMYYCRFSEDVALETSSTRQHICQNVSVGTIMLPFENETRNFKLQYSFIHTDWDVLKINGDKGLPQISHDLF